MVIVLVKDLLFASKIAATARVASVALTMLRDPAQLAAVAGEKLVVDLNQPGAIDAAAEWKTRTGGAVLGFVAHTDGATITHARTAGIDQIFARSAFVAQLPQLLAGEGDAS